MEPNSLPAERYLDAQQARRAYWPFHMHRAVRSCVLDTGRMRRARALAGSIKGRPPADEGGCACEGRPRCAPAGVEVAGAVPRGVRHRIGGAQGTPAGVQERRVQALSPRVTGCLRVPWRLANRRASDSVRVRRRACSVQGDRGRRALARGVLGAAGEA